MRRASLLCALVMTALMLLTLPTLWRQLPPDDDNRMHESLRPARLRTLTVWLLDGGVGDGKLLRECVAGFEREREGVRVFLRSVTPAELSAPDAVKPDVVLHSTGALCGAEGALVPLTGVEGVEEQALAAGQSGGVQLAIPLWLAPNVLGVPREWLTEGQEAPPTEGSLLATRQPQSAQTELLTEANLPWALLTAEGGLEPPEGVALQQLQWMCPDALRAALTGRGEAASTPAPTASASGAWSVSLPVSRGVAPTAPAPASPARVYTLAGYRAAAKQSKLIPVVMRPATSDRVRWLSLCGANEDAAAFARYLCDTARCEQALSHGLLCAAHSGEGTPTDACTEALCERFREGMALPNAFAHTREELYALCADAFRRDADPVETLLRLR